MRIAVTGASGNVGTSLLAALAEEPAVDEIVAIARCRPETHFAKTCWAPADVTHDDLVPLFRGADAVVHLAWAIQPSRDLRALWRTNVLGSQRVLEAAATASVPRLVAASSVGAYSPGPKTRVDESWPTGGTPTAFYALHKAELERRLDRLEREQPAMAVVRLRPGLIFKRESASEQRRLFAGPFLAGSLMRSALWPAVPFVQGLEFQAVHGSDVADAYRRAIVADVRGAFNIAADPVIDAAAMGTLARARPVPLPLPVVRAGMAVTWRLRLQPSSPGWIDMAMATPLMDTSRARRELGWNPRHSALDALRELAEGLRAGEGFATPPLDAAAGGPLRVYELTSGVGSRDRATTVGI